MATVYVVMVSEYRRNGGKLISVHTHKRNALAMMREKAQKYSDELQEMQHPGTMEEGFDLIRVYDANYEYSTFMVVTRQLEN